MGTLRWTPSAVRLLAAIRGRAGYSRSLDPREIVSAIAADTLPGETVTGDALLDGTIWPGANQFITGPLRTTTSPTGSSPVNVDVLVNGAIDHAQHDHARRVGERHLLAALWDLGASELHIIPRDRLFTRVREEELGPAIAASEIEGRWHGLVDTNAVIHFRDLHAIDWRAETGERSVTIWATTVLLDELDELAFEAGARSTARRRARVFSRWLRPHVREAMQPTGYEMREGTRLRLWVPPLSSQPPDGQHLDAAEDLLDRGVPIHVVTNDNGMLARAVARDLDVFELSLASLLEEPIDGSASFVTPAP